jgi:putative SOS response-associated peptidase YedK
MCGRFSLAEDLEAISQRFDVDLIKLEWKPRYNLAPAQKAITIVNEEGDRHAEVMTWGLVPSWAKDRKMGYNLINARSETVATKPSFRHSFKRRRCLVVADGFFEWVDKVPQRITLKDGGLFAFGGLWDEWEGLRTFTIVTTPANELLQSIHDRMPLILKPEDEKIWLDPKIEDPTGLMQPYPSKLLQVYEVSPVVNSWKNDSKECIEKKLSNL